MIIERREVRGQKGTTQVILEPLYATDPTTCKMIREKTGLDEVTNGLDADHFIARWIPHFHISGMRTTGYPNYEVDIYNQMPLDTRAFTSWMLFQHTECCKTELESWGTGKKYSTASKSGS